MLLSALVAALLLTQPPEPPEPPSIPVLIADLRSSAPAPRPRHALNDLISRGQPAVASLYAALESSDFQQRQLAAAALRALSGLSRDSQLPWTDPPLRIEPTDSLIRVCVEGLKSDALPDNSDTPHGLGFAPPVSNAASGTRFLIRHAAKAEPALAQALNSLDLQQRFCAAVILGFARRTAHADRICAILIPHLRNNRIPCDALWAACALVRLGPAADVYLQAAALRPQAAAPSNSTISSDPQQRQLLAHILLDIRSPLPHPNDYGPRATGKLRTLHLDGNNFDPLIAFDQYSLRMDWGEKMTEKNRDTPPPSISSHSILIRPPAPPGFPRTAIPPANIFQSTPGNN